MGVTEDSDGSTAVLRRDLATRDQRTLLAFPDQSVFGPANWRRMLPSPDDRFFAFWESDLPATGSRRLKVIPVDGGEPRTLLTALDATSSPRCTGSVIPLWTSDGRHLLSILRDSVPEGKPCPPTRVSSTRFRLKGATPSRGGLPQSGVWALSPDDSRLAFSHGREAR